MLASFITKAAKKAVQFIMKQFPHTATTQFLKAEAKTSVMGAAMGGVAADFRKDVATRTCNH